MESIIVIVLMLCGTVDTVIVKAPNQQATYTHNLSSPEIVSSLEAIMAQNPIVIKYEEDRGFCA